MGVELITGYSGTPHISSADEGQRLLGTFGAGCYVLDTGSGLACSMSSANAAVIGIGDAVMYGRHVRVDSPETVTIESGTQGQKRNDIVGLHYTRDAVTGVEMVIAKVYKGTPTAGTPADPTYPTTSIADGAAEAFMPLWRIPLSGVSVGTPVQLFETSPTVEALSDDIAGLRESVNQRFERFSYISGGTVQANGNVKISNDYPHAVFLLFFGTWNNSGLYAVFPNNGNTPVSILLAKYGNTPPCLVTAYGSWGLTIANTSTTGMPHTLLRVVK